MLLARNLFFAAPLLAVAGCAPTKPPVASIHPSTQTSLLKHPTTSPLALSPRALLTLDQLEPRLNLEAPATQPSEPPSEEALEAFAKAHIAQLDGDAAEALKMLEKAATLDPTSFALHYELGLAYQGNASTNEKSIHELEKAAALEPDHLELQTNLGRQYLARNDLKTALLYLRLATQTHEYQLDDPRAAVTDFFLASALSRQGLDQAALDVYQRLTARLQSPTMALRMDSESSLLIGHLDSVNFEMAELLQKLHRFDQAAAAYHEAVQNDPNAIELRARECRCLLAAGKNDAAARAAEASVVHFKANQESIDLLREVYRARGREGDSAEALARLRREHPTERALMYAQADLLRALGRADEADRVLAAAEAKYPNDITLLGRRFQIRRARGDLQGAAQLLIDASANSPQMCELIAPMWDEVIRPSSAGRLRLTAIRALPIAPTAQAARLFWFARAARVWHRDAASRDALEEATQLKPAFAPAFRDLLDVIWADSDVDVKTRIQAATQLADRATAAGDAPLADEIAGLLLMRQNEPAKAAGQFAAAIKLGAKSPDVLLARAESLRQSGDTRGFESLMWQLLSDWPALRGPYLELYAYYLRDGSSSQAQRVLSTWFANDPQNVTALEMEARAEVRANRTAAGDAIIKRLLADHGDDADVLESAGDYYTQTDRLDAFLKSLEERRTKEPRNITLAMALAELYARQDRAADASRVLDAARFAAADDPDVLYVLSGLYSRIGQKETSEQVLGQVLKIEPTHAGACNDLGYSWAEQGKNLERAEALIRQAIASEPHNSSFLDSMGWVLYKLGRFAESRQFMDRAVGSSTGGSEIEPDPVVLDHRGDVLYRLGERSAAGADWTRAAEHISATNTTRDDLRDLRLQLQEKQKQLSAGQSVGVAPTGAARPATEQAH
jgi:tetratricopeptide (TPR) repeat protein